MKGKALRKHSLHEKTAASVLLKLFISGKDRQKSTLQIVRIIIFIPDSKISAIPTLIV